DGRGDREGHGQPGTRGNREAQARRGGEEEEEEEEGRGKGQAPQEEEERWKAEAVSRPATVPPRARGGVGRSPRARAPRARGRAAPTPGRMAGIPAAPRCRLRRPSVAARRDPAPAGRRTA